MRLSITRPDDWHLHLRDGAALASVVGYSARQFARAIVMPNLRPPVVSTAQALAYRERILAALRRSVGPDEPAARFEPLMTLYLTDDTAADEIRRAKASGVVHGVKLYPAGATTHSDAGVTDLARCDAALAALQDCGLPLLVHGEVVDPEVDMFDREAVFIERVLIPLRARYPALKVVLEHITTRQAAQYVADAPGPGGPLAATITAHHLRFNRNALFAGGLRPHYYCLPVLKREPHRAALVQLATGGCTRVFLGTDSAPHARPMKEASVCGAGCFTAPAAIEQYAEVFDAAGALDRLEAFASFNGPDFYGLPRNRDRLTLERRAWTLPEQLPFGDDGLQIVPLRAGETLPWALARD
jgi:dihydroorotase